MAAKLPVSFGRKKKTKHTCHFCIRTFVPNTNKWHSLKHGAPVASNIQQGIDEGSNVADDIKLDGI